MVQAARPLAAIKDVLVHSTMQTTLRYAHLQPEHLRDSMAAIDAVLDGPKMAPALGNGQVAGKAL